MASVWRVRLEAEETMAGVGAVIATAVCIYSLPFPIASNNWPGFGQGRSGNRGRAEAEALPEPDPEAKCSVSGVRTER